MNAQGIITQPHCSGSPLVSFHQEAAVLNAQSVISVARGLRIKPKM